jgi:hypothetical protein
MQRSGTKFGADHSGACSIPAGRVTGGLTGRKLASGSARIVYYTARRAMPSMITLQTQLAS